MKKPIVNDPKQWSYKEAGTIKPKPKPKKIPAKPEKKAVDRDPPPDPCWPYPFI